MARTWLSVTVELLGGRGEELWPWPGRVFAVGPVLAPLNIDGTMVVDALGPGEELRFTFDFGDEWVHRCVVGEERIEPLEVLGIRPKHPMPYRGWGSIPDQYGRRWADDDGEGRLPNRPSRSHPMLSHEWPAQPAPAVDLREVRAAIATADADRFLAAVDGRDIDDALQQVGAGVAMALAHRREQSEALALSLANRLVMRAGPGDQVLADDIVGELRRQPVGDRQLPIDLDELCAHLDGDPSLTGGAYVDLRTGDVYDERAADPAMVGEDVAIEGRGAFGRFRRLVHDEGLADPWHRFATDRQWGRARDLLADHGIHVG